MLSESCHKLNNLMKRRKTIRQTSNFKMLEELHNKISYEYEYVFKPLFDEYKSKIALKYKNKMEDHRKKHDEDCDCSDCDILDFWKVVEVDEVSKNLNLLIETDIRCSSLLGIVD